MRTGVSLRALDAIPAPLAVIGGVISVQIGAALARDIFPLIGASGAVLLRMGIAVVCLWALVRPDVIGLLRRAPWEIGLFGISIAFSCLFFFTAVERIPLGVAIAIEFIGPLGVAMWSSKRHVDRLWVALAGGSIVLLVPEIGVTLDIWGVGAAAVAAFFWGMYIVVAPRVGKVAAEFDGLIAALAVACLLLALPGVLAGGPALLDPNVLYLSLPMGILSAVIPFTLDFSALKRLPARTYGVLVCTEPIAGAIVGYLWLNEHLSMATFVAVIGVTIASAGSALTNPGGNHE